MKTFHVPDLLTEWPGKLTGLIVFLAIIVLVTSPSTETAAHIGDFLSGVASTLAFIWLIASFKQQSRELKLQREELTLQRISLDLQREEFKKMSKHSALEQVGKMMEVCSESLKHKNISGCTNPEGLYETLSRSMSLWKTILESKDQEKVFEAWIKWGAIENAVMQYLRTAKAALKLYLDATTEIDTVEWADTPRFLYFNRDKLLQISQLQPYIAPAFPLAQHLVYLEPGIDKVRYAGLTASKALIPGVINEAELEKLRAKIEEFDNQRKANEAKHV